MHLMKWALLAFALHATFALAAKIAIIDSGTDYKHKEFSARMWKSPSATIKDADGVSYNNVINGWNFAENNNQIIDYKYLGTFSKDCYKIFEIQEKVIKGTATQDEKDWYKAKKEDTEFLKELGKFGNFVHGTHVSGISAGNATDASIMGVKLIPTEQPGSRMLALAADFARRGNVNSAAANNPIAKLFLGMMAKQQAQMLTKVGKFVAAAGSEVANGSFGVSVKSAQPVVANLLKSLLGQEPTEAEAKEYTIYFVSEIAKASKDFVAASPKTLFVFAAGNDGTDNDTLPTSPANIKQDNSIAVAATLDTTALASFSNFGVSMVEVAAPGVAILSTIPGDEYLKMSGTSMAAPFVTHVAGKLKDANPTLGPLEIKKMLMATVDKKPFLSGKVASGGIVNAVRAVRAAELSVHFSVAEAIAAARREVSDMPAMNHRGISDADALVLPLPTLLF